MIQVNSINGKVPPTVNLTVIATYLSYSTIDLVANGTVVSAFIADPSADFGTTRIDSAVTGPDGVVVLTVPHNQTVLIVATRNELLSNSITTKANLNQNNVVTIPLAVSDEFNIFLWRSTTSNTFEFGRGNGAPMYRVAFPVRGLAVPERSLVEIEFYEVNITNPKDLQSAPELIAEVPRAPLEEFGRRNSDGISKHDLVSLEVVSMMDLRISRQDTGKVPIITRPVTLTMPIFNLPQDLSVGDSVDAWFFDTSHVNSICPDPGEIEPATRTLSGLQYSNSVQYTCALGFSPEAGYGYRTCLECGTWSDHPVNCAFTRLFP
nr:uncharacterized protein LOC129255886 [Lytechinus pictus]